MTIIDTATVSALLVLVAVAFLAGVVTLGIAFRLYVASRPACPARRAVAIQHARLAHQHVPDIDGRTRQRVRPFCQFEDQLQVLGTANPCSTRLVLRGHRAPASPVLHDGHLGLGQCQQPAAREECLRPPRRVARR